MIHVRCRKRRQPPPKADGPFISRAARRDGDADERLGRAHRGASASARGWARSSSTVWGIVTRPASSAAAVDHEVARPAAVGHASRPPAAYTPTADVVAARAQRVRRAAPAVARARPARGARPPSRARAWSCRTPPCRRRWSAGRAARAARSARARRPGRGWRTASRARPTSTSRPSTSTHAWATGRDLARSLLAGAAPLVLEVQLHVAGPPRRRGRPCVTIRPCSSSIARWQKRSIVVMSWVTRMIVRPSSRRR